MRGSLLAVLLVLAFASSGAAAREPRPQTVAFWTRADGVAILATAPNESAIAVTADGGITWRITARGRFGTSLAVTPGTHVVWATTVTHPCARDQRACLAHLLRSGDGGRTWRRSAVVADRVEFVNKREGWASSFDTGFTLRTHDAGHHWSRAGGPCARGWNQLSVSFVSVSHGWALCPGQSGAGSQERWLYETRDGGRSWRLLPSVPGAGYANGMVFASSTRGWIWQSRGPTLRTMDGGLTWQPTLATAGGLNEVHSMTVRDGTVWMLYDDGIPPRSRSTVLRRSVDHGSTWTTVRQWPPR